MLSALETILKFEKEDLLTAETDNSLPLNAVLDPEPEYGDEPPEAPSEYDGPETLQNAMRALCAKYVDIFSNRVRSQPARTPNDAHGPRDTRALVGTSSSPAPAAGASCQKEKDLTKQVQNLLTLGVIRPLGANAWSQVVLVDKPDGSYRFFVDFNEWNRCTEMNGYPRRSRTLLREVGERRAKFFNVFFDLTAGYYQIALDEEARKLTAFTKNESVHSVFATSSSSV